MSEELSPSQAAARVGTTTRTIQRWIAAGTLPARRVGGRWRVAIDALDALVDPSQPAVQIGELPRPKTPIAILFVANRGEIARRIARTCASLGIRAVVPDTSAAGGLDLLDAAAVVAAAREAGADALHPGYGFLSENADFAAAVIAAGIGWVGPPPEAIRAMGDKAAARRLARTLGIPVVPGYDGGGQDDGTLAREAQRIGFPILIKPAGGGGGKGMRVVHAKSDLPAALAASRREALAAFRDDRLVLERLVEHPRHVEVQVLFDEHGHGVHLGERDCSIQRRHQKVLEESPSPAVTPELRGRLGGYALALASAVGYAGAGTCEFLVADDGGVFFLEMNTRLQVEHPVTELVTGRDLVADQLRIAAGEVLAIDQAEVDATLPGGGHAIEARLYAEDPENGFLPATGRVEALTWPSGEGIRVDAGIEVGDEVTGRFDPMLAKIVAHGSDRAEALQRLARALDATLVLGLTTNLRFLRWLVRLPAVVDGEARIDTLTSAWPPSDEAMVTIPDAAWRRAATALVDAPGAGQTDAWGGGWRLNAAPVIRLVAEDVERSVSIDAGRATAEGPATAGPATAEETVAVRAGGVVHVDVGGRSVAFRVAPSPAVDRAARVAAAAHHGSGGVEIVAPMPGSVLVVHAVVGTVLDAGDPVVTLEAMKMEHVIAAPVAGTLADLRVAEGAQVARGEPLAVVEP